MTADRLLFRTDSREGTVTTWEVSGPAGILLLGHWPEKKALRDAWGRPELVDLTAHSPIELPGLQPIGRCPFVGGDCWSRWSGEEARGILDAVAYGSDTQDLAAIRELMVVLYDEWLRP